MKKPKKNLLMGLSPLKEITEDTVMPRYFDMMWDIKWGYQVLGNTFGILEKPAFYAALAEHGFDAAKVRKYAEMRNLLILNQ